MKAISMNQTQSSPDACGNPSLPLPPDPEVPDLKPRRKFTVGYKIRILQEADACVEPGRIGELLRREGLYSSNLTTWRQQRKQGLLQALAPRKRGRKHQERNPLASRVAMLENENRRLEYKLKPAELIIEAQKKKSEISGITRMIDRNAGSNACKRP